MFRRRQGQARSRRFRRGGFRRGASRYNRFGSMSGYNARSSRGVSPTLAISRPLNPADSMRLKLRTFVQLSGTSTSGATTTGVVKLNSLDVPFTNWGASHSNAAFLALQNQYQRYRVTYAKLHVFAYPMTTSASPVPMWCGVTAWDQGPQSTITATPTAVVESRFGKWGISPEMSGFTGKPLRLICSASPQQVIGCSSLEYVSSPNYAGTLAVGGSQADPAVVCNFYVVFNSGDLTTTTAFVLDMVLEQWVTLYGRVRYN